VRSAVWNYLMAIPPFFPERDSKIGRETNLLREHMKRTQPRTSAEKKKTRRASVPLLDARVSELYGRPKTQAWGGSGRTGRVRVATSLIELRRRRVLDPPSSDLSEHVIGDRSIQRIRQTYGSQTNHSKIIYRRLYRQSSIITKAQSFIRTSGSAGRVIVIRANGG